MKTCKTCLSVIVLLICVQGKAFAEKNTIGWLEKVRLDDLPTLIDAKIDSGADNSSINSVNETTFQQNGQTWVRFEIHDRRGHILKLEKQVVATTRIKMKDGNRQLRNVIEIRICVGHVVKKVRANLVDRRHFKYPVLIGRSYLKGDFLIDSADTFTIEPQCHD